MSQILKNFTISNESNERRRSVIMELIKSKKIVIELKYLKETYPINIIHINII